MARVVDIDWKWRDFKSTLRDADGLELAVGIFKSEIATYAAANEYGTTRAGASGNVIIPSRPFMGNTIDENADRYARQLAELSSKLGGDPAGAMQRLGLQVRNDMVRMIHDSGRWQKNAASTQAKKRGVNKPLVDTGDMQRAITWEVRAKQ